MLTKSAHRGPILLREGAAERSESFNIMIAGGNHTSAIVPLPYKVRCDSPTNRNLFLHTRKGGRPKPPPKGKVMGS